jgi:two-component system response regulator MtrA
VRSPYDRGFAVAVQAADLIIVHEDQAASSLADTCRGLRRRTYRPIVVLTTEASEDLTVAVLSAGADDCLWAGAPLPEIVARVRAQHRRDREYSARQTGLRYEFQGVSLDTGTHEVVVRGQVVALTPKEFELLCALATMGGRAARREQLLQQVWGYGPAIATRTLDVHIGRLRQKIERDPVRPETIVTVPGVGYRLVPQ